MNVLTPHPSAPTASPCDRLSDRQRECLDLAALGLTSARIGDRLGLSPRTVDEHLMAACRLLGVRTRIQAVARLAAVQRPPEPRIFLP
ncbi:helix-turn-helix transcriptional regulator [Brevundimonas sp. SORGH_AS_0993]|uniref:helix-turn-helix domain-containing protein n=1 Tax=Brevundimonas sp. SORGH_AS_0993 TaxID=3041794 RepID=UPI002782D4D1|nr:helix-turn-helix transcriptional regulator [Brevundimonas sp. SORGH_AS_0993]MDQ1153080.1 LuxR family transcriptional regulator of spore coat protein [Brevundimonas sp. SORGH_AS_0993]